jgi:transcriptional antiterminator NusG
MDQVQTDASQSAPVAKPTPSVNARWYVVHVQSGYENKVKQALEQRIKSLSVEDKIFDVVIPLREIVVVKKEKNQRQSKKYSRVMFW